MSQKVQPFFVFVFLLFFLQILQYVGGDKIGCDFSSVEIEMTKLEICIE